MFWKDSFEGKCGRITPVTYNSSTLLSYRFMSKTAHFMLFHHFFLFLIESSRIGGLERGKKNLKRTRQRAGIAEEGGDFHVGGSEGSVDGGA